jgi:AcrR family transcriptional regulator
MRADAARNRGLLLAAAEEEFAARGADASIADIAVRAGVAKGTVFRHFPTKEKLIAAIVAEHVGALSAIARELPERTDAEDALLTFLTAAADRRRQRDITFLLAISADDETVVRVRNQLHDDIDVLVERARAAGAVRSDVTATDVFLLICAPVHVVENLPGAPDDLWRRYLGIIFDGLRPAGAHPLPHGAPIWPG